MLFDDRLTLEIAHAQRDASMLGVLFIDIDHFKPVNDTYGHDVGDRLLQEIAARIRTILREVDTVSRRGGDEFTVIITHVPNREACEKVAMSIIEEIGKPFTIDDIELQVGASIGISLFPDDGINVQQLLTHADDAMYMAKQAGRNTCRSYFSPDRT